MKRSSTVLSFFVAVTLLGGLITLAAPPAFAESYRTDLRASWAYTDARHPRQSAVNTDRDAPAGIWRDDERRIHLSKSYFTFRLSQLQGARIFSVVAFTAETRANDCSRERATELWVTDPAERPTWAAAPKERQKLPGPAAGPCLLPRLEWDATESVRQALAAGEPRVTLALRIAARRQGDFRYGRAYGNDLRITIRYNFPPNTPTDLSTNNRPCTDGHFFTGSRQPVLFARLSDPDGAYGLHGRFALGPSDQPDRRTEHTTALGVSYANWEVPDGVLEHGRTYAWSIRAEDGEDISPWAEVCEFTTDFVRPDVEPTVSSADYPEDCPEPGCGGPGIPGEFAFTANGVADVAGFYYSPDNTREKFVAADRLGGEATVSYTPPGFGTQTLFVKSVDRAGNRSPARRYEFQVHD